jgi:NadR type nicotinamide-nucleotide adenylyltransferase
MANWDYLARCVRPYFAKRVCVFGPESTGKSTLTRRLADHFRTTFVPEYARTLLEFQCGAVTASDMEPIARGQAASEEALARSARRVLLCDTDALTTVIWSEALFGSAPEYVRALAANRTYDLTLLCDVDVPWVADPVRYRPADRDQFFSRCRAAFEEHRRPYVVIRGDWESRFRSAVAAVEGVIGLSAQTRT